jgi:Outer membrane protein transport protein (OMPP1/FadL/TodX)
VQRWYIFPLAATLFWGIGSSSLRADNGNYQNYLVGDRAAGMGGAVVASTNDLDACYYNPAGLANVTGSRIALSVSLYGIYRIWVKEGLGPNESYSSREFESIPSTFGSILKASDELSLAFAVFTPDKIYFNTQRSFERQPFEDGILQSDYYAVTRDDSTIWIGPSLGWKAGERLSFGGGVYFVYRSLNDKQDWTYLFTTEDGNEVVRVFSRQELIDYDNYSLLGLFGARYALTDAFFLGVTVQTPTINLFGDGQLLSGASLGNPEDDFLISVDNMKTRNQIPIKLTVGAAYREPRVFTLEADLTYHFPTSYTEMWGRDIWSGEMIELKARKEGVLNLNLGGEYYIIRNYPFRAGFFTNLSSSPEVDPNEPVIGGEKIDMYGVSASIGNESEHTTINVGINYVWGSGDTLGIGDDFQSVIVDARESYLFLFLSSAYIF